jgi:hypothetical protein
MTARVIRIDGSKHTLTDVVQWLNRNVGLLIHDGGPLDIGRGWKLKTSTETKSGRDGIRRPVASGLYCEFEDWVDDSIILYFALRFA